MLLQRLTKIPRYPVGRQPTNVNAERTVSAMKASAVSESDGEIVVNGAAVFEEGCLLLVIQTSASRWHGSAGRSTCLVKVCNLLARQCIPTRGTR